MSVPREALLTILQAAADEPIGLVLRTSDPGRARTALYKARQDAGADPSLTALQIRISPFEDGDLVICHPTVPRGRRPALDIGDLPE